MAYIGEITKDKTPNSVLKFNARFFTDPALWAKWYIEITPKRKHWKFNAAYLALRGLVLDTKPYKVNTKPAQGSSAN